MRLKIVLGISLLLVPVSGTSSTHAGQAKANRPNIVYIMADDLGIGDVKCYGGDLCRIETPNIDRMAKEGMRFTDAHAPFSVCVPTRVSIMTGRYPWRFRNPRPDGPWGFLNPRIKPGSFTLASMLKQADYHTSYVGKWHLGTEMQTTDGKNQGPENVDYTKPLKIGPADYGFDESFILPGSLDMYPYVFVRNGEFVGDVTAQKGWSAFNRVGPASADFEDTKVLDTFCTEAESFIERQSRQRPGDSPFFLYLALTSPHTPVSPSAAFNGRSDLGLYGDFVMETDHCVGRVCHALKKHGLAENTLLIFTSDHGPGSYAGNLRKATKGQLIELEKVGHHANSIYRGYKFSVYEGGLRVPYIVRWPGNIEPGSQCDRLIGLNDLLATAADVSGAKRKHDQGVDSVSYLPLLKQPQAKRSRSTMIMQGTHGWVVRQGDWKLALCPGSGAGGVWGNTPPYQDAWQAAYASFGEKPGPNDLNRSPFVQLFDLAKDPGEQNNVADEYPERVTAMIAVLDRQIERGRSTPGEPMENDRPRINYHSRVPPFVAK